LKWILIKRLCTQYFFGSDILVAPVTQPVDSITQIATKDIWIPEVRSDAFTVIVNCACFEVKHEDELLHINFLVPQPGYFHFVVFWGDGYWSSEHNKKFHPLWDPSLCQGWQYHPHEDWWLLWVL